MAKKRSRWILTAGAAAVLFAALTAAFWPRAVLVDLGEVRTGDLIVTINEGGGEATKGVNSERKNKDALVVEVLEVSLSNNIAFTG